MTNALSNKLKFIFIAMIFSYGPQLYAQQGSDVANILSKPWPLETKVDSLNELAFEASRSDIDKILPFANMALKLSKNKYSKGEGDAHVRLGMYRKFLGEWKAAIHHYDTALFIRTKAKDTLGIASVYNNIALCRIYMNQPKRALDTLTTAIQWFNLEEANSIHATLYNTMAEAHLWQNNFLEARKYLEKCKTISEQLADPVNLARVMNDLGQVNLELRNFDEAREQFDSSFRYSTQIEDERGMAVAKLSTAHVFFHLIMYEDALTFYQNSLNNQQFLPEYDIAAIHYNMGVIYRAQKKFKLAQDQLYKSQAIYLLSDSPWELADIQYELGNLHFDRGNFNQAKIHYQHCLQNKDVEFDPLVLANVYYNLSESYLSMKQLDSAFLYSQMYLNNRDSISLNRIDAANYSKELEKLAKEKAENEATLSAAALAFEKNESLRLWNYGIATLSFLLLGLFITSILFFKNRQKSIKANFQLYIAEEEIDKAYQQVDNLLQNQEIKLAYAKLEAKDETQRRMGKELHDRIGVMLSTIKLHFTELSDRLNTLQVDSKDKQFKAIELLDETVNEVRRISHDLQNGVLIKMGLAYAVKDLCDAIRDSDRIEVELQIYGMKERIPNNLEVNIYGIIKELIGNVLKHSKAQKLTVYLHRHDQLLNLIVEDNGIGFNPKKVDKKDGTGLKNIAFRAAELNGTCHFDPVDKKGTTVVIDIPIPPSEIKLQHEEN